MSSCICVSHTSHKRSANSADPSKSILELSLEFRLSERVCFAFWASVVRIVSANIFFIDGVVAAVVTVGTFFSGISCVTVYFITNALDAAWAVFSLHISLSQQTTYILDKCREARNSFTAIAHHRITSNFKVSACTTILFIELGLLTYQRTTKFANNTMLKWTTNQWSK